MQPTVALVYNYKMKRSSPIETACHLSLYRPVELLILGFQGPGPELHWNEFELRGCAGVKKRSSASLLSDRD